MGLSAIRLFHLALLISVDHLTPLHHGQESLGAGLAQTSPQETSNSQKAPENHVGGHTQQSDASSCGTPSVAPRISDPSSDLTASDQHASMAMPLWVSQPPKGGMVRWMSVLLWTCRLATIPQIEIKEWEWQRQGSQETYGWERDSPIRSAGNQRSTMEQDHTSQEAGDSESRSWNSTTGYCCSNTFWGDNALRWHRRTPGYGRAVQGQASTRPECGSGANGEGFYILKFHGTKPHACSFEQSESGKIGISKISSQSGAARCPMEGICRSLEGQLHEAERPIHSAAPRGSGYCQSQKEEMGRSSARNPRNYSENIQSWSRGSPDGGRDGSRSDDALGCHHRDPRQRPYGVPRSGSQNAYRECNGTIPRTASWISTRQDEEDGHVAPKSPDYEPSAPFKLLAARDIGLKNTAVIWVIVAIVATCLLFHRTGVCKAYVYLSNIHPGYFTVIPAATSFWAESTSAAELWLRLIGIGEWNYVEDTIFVMFAGVGYVVNTFNGTYIYIMKVFKGILTLYYSNEPTMDMLYMMAFLCSIFGIFLFLYGICRLLVKGFRMLSKFPRRQRQGHLHIIKGAHCNTRGRLSNFKFSKTCFGILLLIYGGEATHILNHSAVLQSLACEKIHECSIGDPIRPPQWLEPDDFPPDPPEPPMVVLMNFARFEDERANVEMMPDDTGETQTLLNMVMFGNDGRPVGRRDAPLQALTNEAIKTAVRETWQDFPFATFQVFSVRPVPDRLRGQGWITLIDIRVPGRRHPPGVITLKETHVYRRSPAFLHELQQFEAFFFTTPSTTTSMVAEAGLTDRCNTLRHGSCTVLKGGQVLLLGFQHGIMSGQHICFLIDEAHPAPPDVVHFENPHSFVQNIQTLFYGAGPRQYLTVLLHGHRTSYLGTRIYGAHRQRLEDLSVFAGDIMSIWQEELFESVQVYGVHPQPLTQDSDGAINFHFLVEFIPSEHPAIVLHRPAEEGYGEFTIIETPDMVSFGRIVDFSPWHVRHPAGHLGDRPLQPADILEITHAMLIRIEGPDIDEEGLELIQLKAFLLSRQPESWYAEDILHGRTVGHNGFQALRPPGNGHGRKVKFSTVTYFVEDGHQFSKMRSCNPFAVHFAEACRQTLEDDDLNPFVTDLRMSVTFEEHALDTGNDFVNNFKSQLRDQSFSNEYAAHLACASPQVQIVNRKSSLMDQVNTGHSQDQEWPHSSAWQELEEIHIFPGQCEIWTPSGLQSFGNADSFRRLQKAGYRIYAVASRERRVLCLGDPHSNVVPTIFHCAGRLWVKYCSLMSHTQELVKHFFPNYDVADNIKIQMAGSSVQMTGPPPLPLRLDDLLPEKPFTVIEMQEVASLHQSLRQPFLPAKIPEYPIEWHEATLMEFQHLAATPPLPCLADRYDFYTDGTSSKGTGAAGVVVIAHQGDQQFWFGARAATADEKTTANRMEASALMIALLWAHDLATLHEEQAHRAIFAFYYDSAITGNIASGIWTSHANVDIHDPNRSLVQWLQERPGVHWIEWAHVAAHKGHPWNEAADTVASAASSGLIQVPPLSCFETQLGDNTTHEWLWFWEKHRWDPQIRFTTTGPKLRVQHTLENQAESGEHAIVHHLSQVEPHHIEDNYERYIHLKMGTANVLSLFPNRKDGQLGNGRYVSARMESLLRQFHNQNYHVIGLQETRSRLLGHQETEHYHVLSHPATQTGHGGVQLWVRKQWKFDDEVMHFHSSHFDILHGDPQLLIVKLQKGALKQLFLVAHAPTTTDLELYQSYWEDTWKQIPQVLSKWPIIMFADANARLSSESDESIGTNSDDIENDQGKIFRQWLNQHSLCLPSTWSCHWGANYTWTHARGQHRARLDYVGLPCEMLENVQCSWIDDEVDLTLKRPDHRVAALQIKWKRPKKQVEAHKRLQRIPPKHFRDYLPKFIQQGYRQEVTTELPLTADGDIHMHAHSLWQGAQRIQHWFRGDRQRLQRNQRLSEETWQLLCARKDKWQNLRYMRYQWKQLLCSSVMKAWKELRGWHTKIRDDFKWNKEISFAIAAEEHMHAHYSAQAVAALRRDDRNFYEGLAAKAKDTEGNPCFLWKYIKPMLPKHSKARENNTRCRGPSTRQLHEHFDHLEAAKPLSYRELLQSCKDRQAREQEQIPKLVNLADLPSRTEIERLCRKVKPDKAPGVDGIEGGLFKYGADLLAPSLHSIFLKAWITGAEPIQWKGGLNVPIWKRRGDPKAAETYRGITLLDGAAKRWHAFLRQRFLHAVQPSRSIGQLGGFPHQQTGYASLYMRSLSAITKTKSLSEGYLFVDLVGAFHYLVREAAFFTENPDDETLRAALQQDDINLDEVILASHSEHAHEQWNQMPKMLQRALQDAHDHTWTSLATPDGILTRTYRGTRPGSPLADLAFNYYLGNILTDIQNCIENDETLIAMSRELGIQLRIISWVDDLVIPLVAPSNQQLMELIQMYTYLLRTVMRRHGFLINFGRGKTEVVVSFRKADAPQWRKKVFIDNQGLWEYETPSGDSIALHCVPCYKHLGAQYGHHGDFRQEITHRIQEAKKAYNQMRKVFSNPYIAPDCKLRLLEALVMSKLFFNSGFWPRLRCEDATKVNHLVIKWQRQVVGEAQMFEVSDAMFRGRWSIPSLEERLSRNRVLAAYQTLQHSPELAWKAAAQAECASSDTWLTLVREGLQWLQQIDEEFGPQQPLQCSAGDLHEWLHNTRNSGPRRVRQLAWKHILQEATMNEVVNHHRKLLVLFEKAGYRFQRESGNFDDPLPTRMEVQFQCDRCPASFPTRQARQAHRWKKHQLLSEERQLLTSSICLACGRDFWTMARAQQHLRRTRNDPTSCFAKLYLAMEPSQAPMHQEVPAHLQGVKYLPTIQRDHQIPLPPKWQRDLEQDWLQLQKEWQAAGLPNKLDEGIYQQIRTMLDQETTLWLQQVQHHEDPSEPWLRRLQEQVECMLCTEGEAAWAFSRWATLHLDIHFDNLDSTADIKTLEDAAQELLREMQIHCLLQRKFCLVHRQPPEVPPLAPPGPGNRGHRENRDGKPQITYALPNEFLSSLDGQKLLNAPSLPLMPVLYDEDTGTYTVLVCHLFSGRRREQDCHWYLEQCELKFTARIRFLILSLDTAVSETEGNLDRGSNWDMLCELLSAAIVAFGLSGPPCETYSAARHLPPPSDELYKWPRPLRHPDQLWGMGQLRCREVRQLTMGSRLLLHSIWMETWVNLGGGATLMEHPTDRADHGIPSAWRASAMQGLLRYLPQYRHNRIEQWQFGSPGIKPTNIRTIGCVRPWEALNNHKLPHVTRPETKLAGLNESGEWKTAIAKEYPPQLSRALASIVQTTVQHKLTTGQYTVHSWRKLSPALLAWVRKVSDDSSRITNAARRPDYQG